MDKIILTTKLSLEDYIKINYHLLYRKWAVRFMTGIGFFMVLSLLFTFDSYIEFPWLQLLLGLFFIIGQPILVYIYARKNYNTNKRISESISYTFDKDTIQITGESFDSKFTWDKIYRVTESKNWILIWQNPQVANVVPKRDFQEEELQAFKNMVSLHSKVKNKLRK